VNASTNADCGRKFLRKGKGWAGDDTVHATKTNRREYTVARYAAAILIELIWKVYFEGFLSKITNLFLIMVSYGYKNIASR